MKKILSLIIVLVSTLVLVGCGNSKPKYSITDDVKIKTEISADEEKSVIDEVRTNLSNAKEATMSFTYTVDSGEFDKDDKKIRYTLEIRYDVIIDETEDKLQLAFGYQGKAKVKENNKTVKKYMFNGTEFVKDDVIYYNTYYQLIKKVDGNEIADVKDRKYKESYKGKLDAFLGEAVVIPNKISDIKTYLDERMVKLNLSIDNEKGKVNKKTTILQAYKKVNDERIPDMRIVFEKGNLTYMGFDYSSALVKKVIVEKQFSIGNAKINFPDLESYKEKDAI